MNTQQASNKRHLARWNNAKRIGEKIKSFTDKGYLVYDGEGDLITDITINNQGVFATLDKSCQLSLFLNDIELDNGMYTNIKEFNERFKSWTFAPVNKVRIFQ